MLPPEYQVDNNGDDDDANPDQRSPVGRTKVDRQVAWKTRKHNDEGRIEERKAVNPDAPAAQAPPCDRKSLAFDAFSQHATDADHVRAEQTQEAQRDDDVKCQSAAEIDQAEQDTGHGSGIDGIEGYLPLLIHGPNPTGEREAFVASEGLEQIDQQVCPTTSFCNSRLHTHISRLAVARAVIFPE